MEVMPTSKLFGTSGIRGPAATLFTPQFCFDIGRTFARFLSAHLQEGRVAVGLDSRQSSPQIKTYLAAGLIHEGREVVDLGCLPVPATHYAIVSGPFMASVMVTGSHIDMASNGLKFFAFKEEITKEHEQEIETIYAQLKDQVKAAPLETNLEISPAGFQNYLELLLSVADLPLPKIKIVFDPGNGGQTETVGSFLRQTGFEVIPLNAHLQDQLISRDTETDGAFAALQEAVKLHGADLGVGFDSDGDRVVFVDRESRFIPGDYSGTILARWFAGEVVVTPINTSNVVNFIHKEVIRTKVGSPHVIAAMKEHAATFGFESNGGGIHADVMLSRDGGVSFVRLLNILKWSQKTLDQLVAELPQLFLRRTKFACPFNQYATILSKAPQFLAARSVDQTDGVKLNLDEKTWVLFRGSGNAPEFRVFVESDSLTKAKQLEQDALTFAKSLIHV